MTRKEIDDIFQEYGQYAAGKDYALVHAIAKTVAAQKCVCGEPNSSGTHRTDGPCLAPQPEQEPATKEQIREAMIFNLPLYTMPPHPDQEPVAWFTATPIEGNGNRVLYEQVSKQYNGTPDTIPLYTTPPQRKPLTDEQIIASNYPDGEENGPTIAAPDFELICFARQIEAAHDIKE